VRLWSLIGTSWVYNSYTYTAATIASGPAQLTTPPPGSTLTASTVQFQWTSGAGATDYWLYVGTTVGGAQLLNQDRGTSLSATVANLPVNGSPVYVRLWSLIAGSWVYNDYTYTAVMTGAAMAELVMPVP